MNEITTTGIILSTMPIGEYDRRVEILSSDLGRITAFARGARRPGSSLVSATRAFAFGTFVLYRGRDSYSLSSASIYNYFNELTENLDVTYYGFYFLELAQYFSRENVESSEMLKLLYFSLKALSLDTIPNKLVKDVYEIKMLAVNGLCPTPDRLASGYGSYKFAADISAGCRKAYSYVLDTAPEKIYTFVLTDECLKEFDMVAEHLIKQSVDKVFKSLSLITDLL